jgi:hypothetical protein
MRDDADEQTSNTHLVAYLLWLFVGPRGTRCQGS